MFEMMDSGFPCCFVWRHAIIFFAVTHPDLITLTILFFHKILNFLGYEIKTKEILIGPSLKILGFRIDTNAMTVTITVEKMRKMSNFLVEASKKQKLSKSKISSIAGNLTWVDKTGKNHEQFTPAAKADDILWFADIILEWPGIHFIREEEWFATSHFGIEQDFALNIIFGLGHGVPIA
ncbi:hypothetical protein BC829DRAFT_419036 [Chytridium lagenaria]|nr:hypothetical protein BC829DRAFT_419036 [Chytridium lagenaria]